MTESETDDMILVRVKSASHPSCEDVEFSCDPKATSVRQVKEKIRILYSFHPDIADQRLIYAGHLLDDLQLLTDVFGLSGTAGSFTSQTSYQHSGPYTIHLACTSKSYVSPNQRSTRNDNHSADSSSHTPIFSSQIPNPMMEDPRMRGNLPGQPNAFDGNNGIPPEFYALHQLYVEQMSAYMRHWNLAYGIRDAFQTGASAAGNSPNFVPNANVNAPGNVPPAAQPQPAAAPNAAPPQNDRARQGAGNFGGLGGLIGGPGAGVGNDDEENQRDLLDWAYTLSRVILILSVVYFYSSFARFLLVVIFTLAIALFQRRPVQNQEAQHGANERQGNNNNNNRANPAAAPARGENENRNEPRPEDGENQDANPVNNDAEGSNNNANATSNSGNSEEGQAAEDNVAAGAADGQQRFAYYREVTWTFLTTFFTSLIPEMPQHN